MGIAHQRSAPYSHQQMGLVERRHRHLIYTTVTMLKHASLSNAFWDYGVLTTYLYNQNPTPLLTGRSPLEALLGKKPKYERLTVFGSLCFPCLRSYRGNKFDSKSRPCIFIGYSMGQNYYLYFELDNWRIFASRDVVFNKLDFSLNKHYFTDENTNCRNQFQERENNRGKGLMDLAALGYDTELGLPVVVSKLSQEPILPSHEEA